MELLNVIPDFISNANTITDMVGYASTVFVAAFGLLAVLFYPS